MTSALQNWVMDLSIMKQSVLMAAIRAPDGIKKDHPTKRMMRWYRRSILISAFDGQAINDPWSEGGGSFTGPSGNRSSDDPFETVREEYLRHVDELPHHFQLHLMHGAQIIGHHHPDRWIMDWWMHFYVMIVNDAHLTPEPRTDFHLRLSDNPHEWRKREVVVATGPTGIFQEGPMSIREGMLKAREERDQ